MMGIITLEDVIEKLIQVDHRWETGGGLTWRDFSPGESPGGQRAQSMVKKTM